MATVNELPAARTWIYGKLVADATVAAAVGERVYHGQAPQGATYPLIVFNLQAATDTRGVCAVRLLTRLLFLIKLVTDGPPDDTATAAASAFDTLFQEATTEVQSGLVFSARRERPIEFIEPRKDGAGHYNHLGGEYRLFIHPEAS